MINMMMDRCLSKEKWKIVNLAREQHISDFILF